MVGTLVAGCTPSSEPPDRAGAEAEAPAAISEALSRALETIRTEAGFPGMTAAVVLPDGRVVAGAAGVADSESGRLMQNDQLMPAGSIGKTFVAATALELVAEGRLALDQPIGVVLGAQPWYAGMPNGDAITLRMLLNHSSGIVADYVTDDAIFPMFERTFGSGGTSMASQGFTHADIGRAIARSVPAFAAGTGFAYSDANYAIAALLIEAVTGRSLAEEIAQRFLEPLGLHDIMPTPRQSARYAAGYEPEAGVLPGAPRKLLDADGRLYFDPSLEWAGGGYAATAADLARWAGLLYGARAIAPTLVLEMVGSANPHTPVELRWQYGLGVQVGTDALGLRLMHGGYLPGYSSYMEYRPEHRMSLAFQANTRSGFTANRAIATRLWGVIDSVSGERARTP